MSNTKYDTLPNHNQVCKQILGLRQFTSNLGARVELGRLPISTDVIKSTLNYWLKLEKSEVGSIMNQCLESEKELCEKNIVSWYSLVKLMQCRYADSIHDPCHVGVRGMCEGLADNFKNQSIKALTVSRVTGQGSKLRTYAKIKTSWGVESYLLGNRLSWKQKRLVAKFRLSNHCLRIETGRHCRPRLPPEQRTCEACTTHSVECEIHFLIGCPRYANLREKYSIKADMADSTASFVHIMCSTDPSVWANVSGYLDEAFHMREELNI